MAICRQSSTQSQVARCGKHLSPTANRFSLRCLSDSPEFAHLWFARQAAGDAENGDAPWRECWRTVWAPGNSAGQGNFEGVFALQSGHAHRSRPPLRQRLPVVSACSAREPVFCSKKLLELQPPVSIFVALHHVTHYTYDRPI